MSPLHWKGDQQNVMTRLFFDNWEGVIRTLVLGITSYVALVCFLRISGKRTLSKMNAFDLVVTVALGSSLATIILNKNVALVEGVLVFVLLIGLQFMVAWLSVRSKRFEGLVKSEPMLVMRDGHLLHRAMASERGV